MSAARPATPRARAALAAWLTAVLAVSAVVATGYRLSLALGRGDSDALESTRVLPVARQITEGPGGLYGPFGGRNPFVLIHAPLYYRVSALLAWPLVRAGLGPVTASLAVGRSLSVLALLVTLGLADRLARLGGAPRRAGVWAALLVAALPVLGALPVTVRADVPGVALQTAGVLLVLSAVVAGPKGPSAPIVAGYAAFGAALCVKQHLVAAPAVSTVLLLAAGVPVKRALRGALLALAVVVVVYGADGLLTGGRTFQAVFGVAAVVGRVRPSDWPRAIAVTIEVIHWGLGTTALLAAAGLAAVPARAGKGRIAYAVAGAGVLVATLVVSAVGGRHGGNGVPPLLGGAVILPLLILACATIEPRRFLGDRVDAALWVYWLGEVALTLYLFKSSTGSWTNYALQAGVFASVLTARALARAFDLASSPVALVPAALAALTVLHLAWVDASDDHQRRLRDRTAVAAVVRSVGEGPRAFFFVGRPDLNLIHGRPDLVYDDWLYPVFESVGLAERRSVWLPRVLGPTVRYAVMSNPGTRVDGLDKSLPELGFFPSRRVGPFFVWEQSAGRRD